MDRTTAKALSAATEKALQEVAEQFGLTVEVRGGSYDSDGFTPKVSYKVADADRREFERWADLYDLQPSDFGRAFTAGGKRYTVCGISPRSPKRPILAKDAQGRTFKFTVEGARRALLAS